MSRTRKNSIELLGQVLVHYTDNNHNQVTLLVKEHERGHIVDEFNRLLEKNHTRAKLKLDSTACLTIVDEFNRLLKEGT